MTTATAPAPTTTSTSTPTSCPNVHGGLCLGTLDAGYHTTRSFDPQIDYTVPDGWVNLEDLPGNFLLQMTNDVRYLGIYQNVRAPADCREEWAEGVDGTVEDLVGWYETHPGLITTEPRDTTVGGLSGVFFDISLDPSWQVTCPYSEGQPVVPFIIGNGTSELHHVILPGFEERLYLLEWKGGNVAIEVGPEGSSLDEYLIDVLPITESLTFGS
ncbi:MAG TPA: hypothetical protein VHL52_11335 [Acidimicrobiia bacterium]|nr:hypothetical protein [Acidimicrobiia bacterium]